MREFEEETGQPLKAVPFALCYVRQAGGKLVEVFACEGRCRSGKDRRASSSRWNGRPKAANCRRSPRPRRARWMPIAEARRLMLPSQLPILDALEANA